MVSILHVKSGKIPFFVSPPSSWLSSKAPVPGQCITVWITHFLTSVTDKFGKFNIYTFSLTHSIHILDSDIMVEAFCYIHCQWWKFSAASFCYHWGITCFSPLLLVIFWKSLSERVQNFLAQQGRMWAESGVPQCGRGGHCSHSIGNVEGLSGTYRGYSQHETNPKDPGGT